MSEIDPGHQLRFGGKKWFDQLGLCDSVYRRGWHLMLLGSVIVEGIRMVGWTGQVVMVEGKYQGGFGFSEEGGKGVTGSGFDPGFISFGVLGFGCGLGLGNNKKGGAGCVCFVGFRK
jgi:hypothetical protein